MKEVITTVIVLVFFVVLVVVSLQPSYPQGYTKLEIRTNADGIQYQMFTIEGMPCIRVGDTKVYGTNKISDGVSCDWSKWKGN